MAENDPVRDIDEYMPLFNILISALVSLLLPMRKRESEQFAKAIAQCKDAFEKHGDTLTKVAHSEDEGPSWLETIKTIIAMPRVTSLTFQQKVAFSYAVLQLVMRTLRCAPETIYQSAYKIDDMRLELLVEIRTGLDEIITDIESHDVSDALETAKQLREQLTGWEDRISKQLTKWEDALADSDGDASDQLTP